jgi:hypothetical protein
MFRIVSTVKKSEICQRIKEKLFPEYLKNEFPIAMERYRKCDQVKPTSQMKKEIRSYKKFWKCYPYFYFLADLYRVDNQLSPEEILNYIPAFFWDELYLPHHTDYMNSPLIDNKIFTTDIFRGLGIPQPETISSVIDNRLYSSTMKKTTFDKIILDIEKQRPEKIFLKPAESGAGRGILIFHRTNGGPYITRQNDKFDEHLLLTKSKNTDYIIQAGVIQNPELSKIFPGSVNTCRIVTENLDGVSRAVCAILRVGSGQSDIDNASTGGMFIKIDMESGRVGDYAITMKYEKLLEHPDTNFKFHHFIIPQWTEIRKLAETSAEKLPLFVHLGWDIALSLRGPLVIETNLNPGINTLQFANGGLREKFGITDPDYYWKNPGKRR